MRVSGLISGNPVYVSGGKVHVISTDSTLMRIDHEAAGPYLWPLAHDVRPALQSLGVRGCNDCHTTDSNFYFGKVSIKTPLNMLRGEKHSMTAYLDQNPIAAWVFSFSFFFRPGLKYIILISSLLTLAILLLYGFRGLARIISVLSENGHTKDEGR
jgi:hypothetical protein